VIRFGNAEKCQGKLYVGGYVVENGVAGADVRPPVGPASEDIGVSYHTALQSVYTYRSRTPTALLQAGSPKIKTPTRSPIPFIKA
jgi:hypothetical protein